MPTKKPKPKKPQGITVRDPRALNKRIDQLRGELRGALGVMLYESNRSNKLVFSLNERLLKLEKPTAKGKRK